MLKHIDFHKLSGCGNDFIIIDNRKKIVEETNFSQFVANVCRRKMSAGADGLILVEPSETADFKWQFFNSDGTRAEMCGNGARCAARFAYVNGIAGPEMSFETEVGLISAHVINDRVKINVPDPTALRTDFPLELEEKQLSVSRVNTGVPHVIIETDSPDDAQVIKLGREIRFHKDFAPEGTNVNFVCSHKDGTLTNRTYERGVEDETLACGTGCIGAAIVMASKSKTKSPTRVNTRSGGYLTIHYKQKQDQFYDIYLEGDARIIYRGELWKDAWN
ncbi:diaminopimelate epimerase [Desulfonema magnum]|uniref:Diaminopimelate epimerase n=1 Tax=Desulfonema magnum TaxID=45655 RepID=A0A975BN44_9BACT|nr:diaminopimelate epimerase [Desulfonema magnum]QTA88568.1 Diaminopimelate epimerase [Desulfonema magnum]